MKTILIFEPQTGGHRANFIRWLKQAIENISPSNYRFIFVTAAEAEMISPGIGRKLDMADRWKKPWILYRLFRKVCKQFAPDHVLVLELTHLELPFALLGSPAPLSAILFVQYPELSSGLKFFFKHWKTRGLLWRAPVKNIFLLNGEKSCRFLTEHFSERARFIPIADPAPEILAEPTFNLRKHFGISGDRKIFLFFGAISRRKGADILLKTLKKITPESAACSAFVFSGAVDVFYRAAFQKACAALRAVRPDVSFHVEDIFVSDERMMALFEQSDGVLMPYTRPEYSSGILALAARVGKPVLGPESGLIGRLITENALGVTTPITPDALADALARPIFADTSKQRAFLLKSQIDDFATRILKTICNES